MKLMRDLIDNWYVAHRDRLFKETEDDPERAHEWFIRRARLIHRFRLERLLLDCPENRLRPGFTISNGAGFNKNGTIPPTFFKWLGCDEAVIGAITYDAWEGNPKNAESPTRTWRYPDTDSMVNYWGLPGIGARAVAEVLNSYGNHGVPLILNIMSTPQKQGAALLRDLESTVKATRQVRFVRGYELNISCPNTPPATHSSDSCADYRIGLGDMISVVSCGLLPHQTLDIKVSPDMNFQTVRDTIEVCRDYPRVRGFVTTNTTKEHDPRYIPSSPGKGGASGDAVYTKALFVQRAFESLIDTLGLSYELRASGGIRSIARARERTQHPKVKGIQVLTPVIMQGSRVIRLLRRSYDPPL